MFTGIIEHVGTIEALDLKPGRGRITIHTPSLAPSLAISKSVAVNGCCLTVVALGKKQFSADLSGETIQKTSFGAKDGWLKKGSRVNLEQPLLPAQNSAATSFRDTSTVRAASRVLSQKAWETAVGYSA